MREICAPITAVTLFEDRATVRRTARLELEEGFNRLLIAPVSPVLVDKTLTAQVTGSGARVVEVSVGRRRPETPTAPARRDGPDLEQSQRLNHIELTKGELELSRTVLAQALGQAVAEVAAGEFERPDWEERLDELSSWGEQLVQRQQDLVEQLPDPPVAPETVAAQPLKTSVVVLVEAAVAGPVDLVVDYTVPGACWRPYHLAELSAGEDRVVFRCDGCAWQNTGEDWESVDLHFSTQRPSLGIDPPQLGADALEVCRKAPEQRVEVRDQEIKGLGPEPTVTMVSAGPPGIDDRGEVVKLSAAGKSTVRSNGQPVRLELFSFEAFTRLKRVLMAEVTPDVILKTVLENSSAFPILAGPVDLIRGGGLTGRAKLLYVAPGGSFALGWGADPSLRVRRWAEVGEENKDDFMGRWRVVEHSVNLKLSNLGLDGRTVEVTERVPVSEVKEVEVVCQDHCPDDNGFVSWCVELGPRGRHEIALTYSVRRRREVVTT